VEEDLPSSSVPPRALPAALAVVGEKKIIKLMGRSKLPMHRRATQCFFAHFLTRFFFTQQRGNCLCTSSSLPTGPHPVNLPSYEIGEVKR